MTDSITEAAILASPAEDRWQQMGEAEAQIAYNMTLRNELSGISPSIRSFELKKRGQPLKVEIYGHLNSLFKG